MKTIRISIDDAEYRRGLAEILIAEGATPLTFEVPDDYDVDSYEGLEVVSATPKALPAEFNRVQAWLLDYKGDSPFYLSLRSQLLAKGILSEKQMACIERAIAAEGSAIEGASAKLVEYSIKPGETVIVSKFIANKIAREIGFSRAHRALDVVECLGESAKAYRIKVKLSARKTSHCGICGIVLENPDSIAAGIGPICAENYGIPYGENSAKELEKLLALTPTEAITWVPKASIKERFEKR